MLRFETKRLVLRDHIPDDLSSMHILLSDRKAMYYLDDIQTDGLDGTCRNLETAISEANQTNRRKFFFAILEKESGEYIGEVGYTVTVQTPLGCIAGLGYFIKPAYWGRGITTEASREVLRYAFEQGDIIKMETGCISENAASEAVMKKLGMTREACLRCHVWHDGRFKDRVEYGMLRDEWKAHNKTQEEPI